MSTVPNYTPFGSRTGLSARTGFGGQKTGHQEAGISPLITHNLGPIALSQLAAPTNEIDPSIARGLRTSFIKAAFYPLQHF